MAAPPKPTASSEFKPAEASVPASGVSELGTPISRLAEWGNSVPKWFEKSVPAEPSAAFREAPKVTSLTPMLAALPLWLKLKTMLSWAAEPKARPAVGSAPLAATRTAIFRVFWMHRPSLLGVWVGVLSRQRGGAPPQVGSSRLPAI